MADICKNHEYRGNITASVHTPKRGVFYEYMCLYCNRDQHLALKTMIIAWSARFWLVKFWRWGALTNVYWLALCSALTELPGNARSKSFWNRLWLENVNVRGCTSNTQCYLLTKLILCWSHNTSCSLYWANIELFGEISKITAFGKNHGKWRKSQKSRLPWFHGFLLSLIISVRVLFIKL